jgi:hypothetical protein
MFTASVPKGKPAEQAKFGGIDTVAQRTAALGSGQTTKQSVSGVHLAVPDGARERMGSHTRGCCGTRCTWRQKASVFNLR